MMKRRVVLALAAIVSALSLAGQPASAATAEPGGSVQFRSDKPFMVCYYQDGHLLWCDIYG